MLHKIKYGLFHDKKNQFVEYFTDLSLPDLDKFYHEQKRKMYINSLSHSEYIPELKRFDTVEAICC